ncbi:MAG TPA: hypothetical protein VIM11_18125 [Tepidisphaeraceae bacterium]|jgi:hypothetical protein
MSKPSVLGRIFGFASASSLLLCAAAVALWVNRDNWVMNSSASSRVLSRRHSVWLLPRGSLYYDNIPMTRQPDGSWQYFFNTADFNWSGDPWILFRTIPYAPSGHGIMLVVQYRLLAMVFAVLPMVWLFTRRRKRRTGTCEMCGYDLTGNASGVCPECGAAIGLPDDPLEKPMIFK